MNTWKRTILILLVFISILSLILSACELINNGNNGKDKDKTTNANKITICHRTGSTKNPYKEITIAKDATTDGHASHEGDIIPAPADGCPKKQCGVSLTNGIRKFA